MYLIYSTSYSNFNASSIKILASFLILFSCSFVHAQQFVEGYIVLNSGDTVGADIFKYKKKKDEISKACAEILILENGVEKKFVPADVRGYGKGGSIYVSINHRIEKTNERLETFARVITHGRVTLLHVPFSKYGEKYFFRKDNERAWQMLDAILNVKVESRSTATYGNANTQGGGVRITDYEQAFQEYFIHYFTDCPVIARKLKTQFYTSSDIIDMFIEYNECR